MVMSAAEEEDTQEDQGAAEREMRRLKKELHNANGDNAKSDGLDFDESDSDEDLDPESDLGPDDADPLQVATSPPGPPPSPSSSCPLAAAAVVNTSARVRPVKGDWGRAFAGVRMAATRVKMQKGQ